MVRRVGSWDSHVEGLKWTLLAALGIAACSGRSERRIDPDGEAGEAGSGATGGTSARGGTGAKGGSGATGGTVSRGGSGVGAEGGTGVGATGGSGAIGGSGAVAGTGATSGAGGSGAIGGTGMGGVAGEGGFRPNGCAAAAGYSDNLEECGGGFVHRPTSNACTLSPRSSPADAGAGGETSSELPCDFDSDCTEKPNGYCVVENPLPEIATATYCLYSCQQDADCGEEEVCSCESTYQRQGTKEFLDLGICRPATCGNDGSCVAGMLCISAVDAACGTPRPGAYHCQSEADECAGPGDCPAFGVCQHDGDHFVCTGRPVCGRPFVVGDTARTAARGGGSAWDAAKLDRVVALTLAERAAVAEHYRSAALMEHASIAAFARFTLELVALGAPEELVSASISAMADETRHTRLCTELANRYADSEFAPGALDVSDALSEPDLLSVVDRAVIEGVLGETSAALEASLACDGAEDESVGRALATIAADEGRHAALAFRFIAWAASRDARVLPLVERRLAEARARLRIEANQAETSPVAVLCAHGVLDAGTRRAALRSVLDEIVPSALAALRSPPVCLSLELSHTAEHGGAGAWCAA